MEDIKTSPQSMQSLINAINKGKYNFDLPIQRRAGIWNRKELSLFIDSILRFYPIYPALLNKHSDTKVLDVVDFKQRFTGLADFANNKFSLSKDLKPIIIDGVEYEIAGKKFKNLDEVLQERFNNRDLTVVTMIDATSEEINDIFDRINMGHPLSNGHKRSTIESDETRDIIYSLAAHPFFEKVLTKAQYKKNFDRDTVIQILMLCEMSNEYDFGSFRNEDMNKFIIYYNQLISDQKTRDKTLAKVDIIRKALNKLDEEFTESVKIKNSSLALCVYGLYRNIKDSKSTSKYIAWLHNFINTYDTNEAYLVYCSSGTASAENVKGRLQYFKDAIKTM
ncbi:MAG: DUF262 domain-containing protein [Ruminococcus flavefaciens]|nr:DUF262 domain-containing protein [Ruminococcus flavefaciens]